MKGDFEMKKMLMLMLAFVFALSFSTAYAQGTMGSSRDMRGSQDQMGSQGQTTQLSKTDRDFITQAAKGGMTEVELGKLAESKGTSQQVKEMGRKLVDDHTKANDQLMSLAQSKGFTLQAGLDKSDRKELDKLSREKDFDKAFVKQVKKDHEKDLSLFKKEAKDGKDPDLKNFASQMVPALQDYLNMTKEMSNTGSHSASSRQY